MAVVRVTSVRTFQGYICLVHLPCWPTSPLSVFEVVFQIIIGVNISERKSGTERTKKRESLFFPPPGRATGNYTDFARATIQPGISLSRARIPGHTRMVWLCCRPF